MSDFIIEYSVPYMHKHNRRVYSPFRWNYYSIADCNSVKHRVRFRQGAKSGILYLRTMPELPDVEAVISRIRERLIGRSIIGVKVFDMRLAAPDLSRPISGKRIRGISRRGKYILVSLDGLTLVIHLRMTGDLVITNPEERTDKHTRLGILLSDGRELRFVDQRRLGVAKVVPNEDFRGIPGLVRLGPEPLSGDFTFEVFKTRLGKRRSTIKSALMNQSFVAGVGNIYGDEILFQSGLRPARKANGLTDKEMRTLYRKMRHVLNTACAHDADLSGLRRWFVHGRTKGRCPKCGAGLERRRIQGRYSYFCAHCQR